MYAWYAVRIREDTAACHAQGCSYTPWDLQPVASQSRTKAHGGHKGPLSIVGFAAHAQCFGRPCAQNAIALGRDLLLERLLKQSWHMATCMSRYVHMVMRHA